MEDPRRPKARTWSLLLSSLALTPDEGLAAFRERRLGDPRIELSKLRQARAILDSVAQALESRDAARWQRLTQAFELLAPDGPTASQPSDVSPRAAAAPRTSAVPASVAN